MSLTLSKFRYVLKVFKHFLQYHAIKTTLLKLALFFCCVDFFLHPIGSVNTTYESLEQSLFESYSC